MDTITLNISGDNRHVSAEVFLLQVARALRSTDLKAGEHHFVIDREGGVWLGVEKIFTPPRPLIAQKAG